VAKLGDQEPVARARDAVARQAWQEAYDLLTEADGSRQLDTDGVAMRAEIAYLVGEPRVSGNAWKRVHAARLAEGDREGAAAAAARIAHLLFDEGLEAPLRGWVMRGRELLTDLPDSPVHAALSVEMAWAALIYAGDADTALQEARRAVEIASRAGDPTMRALAINAEGRALIQLGQIQEGLALLDESTVAAMTGELDGMATVVLFCSTICALQALAEYDRADQWTQAMEQWTADRPLGPFQGVCRVHRAEILRLRGAWHDAEREARRASEEIRPFAGTVTGWPLGELGSVRLRMGNLEGAEDAFLRATQAGWDPQPGIALLRLAQGDPLAADAEIRDALEHPAQSNWERPPSSELQRAPLLAAQVEIAVAVGDLERARWATEELDQIALSFGSKAIKASAATARGTVLLAEKDLPEAIRSLEDGATKWKEIGAPYESARARASLASAHRMDGNEKRATIELRAARSTFDRLGATLDAANAAEAMGDVPADGQVPEAVDKVFMFTDIVQSTNLAEAIGDEAWGRLVHWHNQKIGSLVLAHGGGVVRTTGDGFFVTFDTAGDAAECAIAVQRALEENRRQNGFFPEVRIGFHGASANPDGRDWSGKGVHAAARIGAMADGSQILASRTTAQAAGHGSDAPPQVVSLKGISEPVEVVAISWR
jgi:class 3 adenylate cyclase